MIWILSTTLLSHTSDWTCAGEVVQSSSWWSTKCLPARWRPFSQLWPGSEEIKSGTERANGPCCATSKRPIYGRNATSFQDGLTISDTIVDGLHQTESYRPGFAISTTERN